MQFGLLPYMEIQTNEAVGCGIFWVVARVALVQMLKAAGMAGKDPNHI